MVLVPVKASSNVGVGVALGCGHSGHARKPYSHVVVGWVKRGSEMRSAVSHANPKATGLT
jgi:hypothetical protein